MGRRRCRYPRRVNHVAAAPLVASRRVTALAAGSRSCRCWQPPPTPSPGELERPARWWQPRCPARCWCGIPLALFVLITLLVYRRRRWPRRAQRSGGRDAATTSGSAAAGQGATKALGGRQPADAVGDRWRQWPLVSGFSAARAPRDRPGDPGGRAGLPLRVLGLRRRRRGRAPASSPSGCTRALVGPGAQRPDHGRPGRPAARGRHRRRGTPAADRRRGRARRPRDAVARSPPATWSAASRRGIAMLAEHARTPSGPCTLRPSREPRRQPAASVGLGGQGADDVGAALARRSAWRPGWPASARATRRRRSSGLAAGQRPREHVLQDRRTPCWVPCSSQIVSAASRYFSRYGASTLLLAGAHGTTQAMLRWVSLGTSSRSTASCHACALASAVGRDGERRGRVLLAGDRVVAVQLLGDLGLVGAAGAAPAP